MVGLTQVERSDLYHDLIRSFEGDCETEMSLEVFEVLDVIKYAFQLLVLFCPDHSGHLHRQSGGISHCHSDGERDQRTGRSGQSGRDTIRHCGQVQVIKQQVFSIVVIKYKLMLKIINPHPPHPLP